MAAAQNNNLELYESYEEKDGIKPLQN